MAVTSHHRQTKMSPKLQKMKVLGIKETAGKQAGPYKVPPTHSAHMWYNLRLTN